MIGLPICQSCIAHQNPAAIRYASKCAASKKWKTLQPRNPEDAFNMVALNDHCFYWDTQVPQLSQFEYADRFFTPSRHSPLRLWSASKFRTIPISSVPEVAFFGRSNVGKSSLLNALMGQKLCWTSSKPGRTREMNAFGVGGMKGGESRVVLMDMPGYGKGSRDEWGEEIMKYLTGRKQSVWSSGTSLLHILVCTSLLKDLYYLFHFPEDYKANWYNFSISDYEELFY